jgi:hypothetical protein
MFRSVCVGLALMLCSLPVWSQEDAASLESYFTGKEVVVKLDMPGTQKGIDLKFNKPVAMDWNEYSSRIKSSGIALRKGDSARITKFLVKNDMIEFQLNGGGFGTAGDDSSTTVYAPTTPKSSYEKDLQRQIDSTSDAKKKRDLQQDLDRERSRRERRDSASRNDAMIASQLKSQQVAGKRLQGGSRFNLRWQGSIPSDSRNPETVMKLLADYVDFGVPVRSDADAGPAPSAGEGASGPVTNQLQRGMRIDEVTRLLGRGTIVSDSVSQDGLKTQVFEFVTADSVADVTCVEGVVVRYSIRSK